MFQMRSLFTLGLLALTISLSAQVSSQRLTMSEGVYEALVLDIPNLEPKTVGDLWGDFTKDFYDSRSRYNRRAKEYLTDDADIAALGLGNTVDIYVNIEEVGDGSRLAMWVDLGGAYMSAAEHPERTIEAEKILMRFGLEAAKEVLRRDIEEQEKVVERMERDLRQLENAKERFERDIERAQEAIREAEEGIVENAEEQQAKRLQIEEQQAIIEAIQRRLNEL